MAEVDGRVYIDTELQTDGFEAGSKDVEIAARRMAKTVKNIGESAKISLQKQTNAFVKQNQMLAQQKAKVAALEAEYERLSNQQIETDEFAEIGRQIDSDTTKLNNLEKAQEEFLRLGGKTKSKVYQKRQLEIEELRNSIRHAKSEQDELLASGGAYQKVDTSGVQQKLANETQKLWQMNEALGTSYASLKQKVNAYGGSAEKVLGIKGKLISSFKKFGTTIKNVGKKMLGLNKDTKKGRLSMKRMLATSLLLGFAFQAFSKVLQGLKDGMNNLAQYSDETNADLSALKSSLTRLKNSFATAFAPILTVITPILTGLINLLSKAVTYIGMFFAALSGKTTFTKAVEVQEDYAAGLGDTASNAEDAEKALKGYLSPIDEINKMESEDSSKSGTVSPEDMFETVEIESSVTKVVETVKKKFAGLVNKVKEFGRRIKQSTTEWFSGLDWQPILTALDGFVVKLEPVIELIANGLGWTYENVLLPFGKWALEEGLPAIIDAFSGLADFITGVFTGDWELAFSGLQTILNSYLTYVNAVFGFIQNSILIPFDKFLQGVFEKDWTIEFGIFGTVLNDFFVSVKYIWNGIKDIFYGVIIFINGTFTGDWKKSLEGLKQIFKGIFSALVGIVREPVNRIIGIINGMISGIVSGINTVIKAVNSISFDMPEWLGGGHVGFNLKTVTAPQIPYLATGAVIPPNAPFMAVLGDQKQGTNIETPEKLLRQIIREELGGRQSSTGGTYKFVGQINRRVLFEEVITEAKLRRSQNGRNPFELA